MKRGWSFTIAPFFVGSVCELQRSLLIMVRLLPVSPEREDIGFHFNHIASDKIHERLKVLIRVTLPIGEGWGGATHGHGVINYFPY